MAVITGVTAVVDSGAQLELTIGGNITAIEKNEVIHVKINEQNDLYLSMQGGLGYFLLFSELTSPIEVSDSALQATIQGFLDLGTSEQVTTVPVGVTLTDGSGGLTTGGVSQEVFPVKANRKYLQLQNISDEDLYYRWGSAAIIGNASFLLAANGGSTTENGTSIPTQSLNIIGTTTNKRFVATEG